MLAPLALLLAVCLPTCAQTPAQELDPELAGLGEQLVSRLRELRPDWTHDAVPPATPPGDKPSSTVAIHFWRSHKCLTAERDNKGTPEDVPLACVVKVAVYLFDTREQNHKFLDDFIGRERLRGPKPTSIAAGDEGYVWGRGNVIFVKGRFMFWLDIGVQDDVPGARLKSEATGQDVLQEFAKEIAAAAPGS
ncbi:MAG TPA: hypothetical protein VF546_18440 [Pyrinomonadaceae bacterium]